MGKKTFILFFLLFCSGWIYAQSFYEMDFHFEQVVEQQKVRSEFKSFYLLNEDGSGLMRVQMPGEKEGQFEIIECDLKQGFFKEKDGTINYDKMYYTGSNFTSIVGDTTGVSTIPKINFWFKMNKQENYYEPWAVMTKDENNKNLQGVISDIRLLNQKDLTKELILQYFTRDEEIYKNLFETNTRAVSTEVKGSKMYFIAIIDTEDEKIGNDCKKDLEAQTRYFTRISTKLGIELVPKQLLGKDLSKANVLNLISQVNPTRSDIVIYYYSGHGYSKEDGRLFPYMDLRYDKDIAIRPGDELNMEEVYEMIKNKNGRLNLVISDCCNWHQDATNVMSSNIANTRAGAVEKSIQNMQSLFMNPNRFSLLMTAAAKGQVSAGNPMEGGIFTGQFRDALDKFLSITYQDPEWKQVVISAQAQTKELASLKTCEVPGITPKQYRDCEQLPVYKIN